MADAIEPNGFRELEAKLVVPPGFSGSARRRYAEIFAAVVAARSEFPDQACLSGYSGQPRAGEIKDLRRRLYFADERFLLIDAKWEIRLECDSRVLMVKHGNGSDGDTMNREEIKYRMCVPVLQHISDIEKNHSKKKPPAGLCEIFDGGDADLYPVVESRSWRKKLVYYRLVEHGGRNYRVAFELARDVGVAFPLAGASYEIDQLELEVKEVVDTATGADVLEAAENIAVLALRTESAALKEKFGLVSMNTSKPQRGFDLARAAMQKPEGKKKAVAARRKHAANPMLPVLISGA